MGTSTSSTGSGPNVPFIPPWENKLQALPLGSGEVELVPTEENNEETNDTEDNTDTENNSELSPPRRYANARRELRNYALSSDKSYFNRAVGNYSKFGSGGAKKASRKMKTSTKAAANLLSLLMSLRDGNNNLINSWAEKLLNKKPSAQEIIDAIIFETTTSGGTVDEESIKNSMSFAMSELINRDKDIDLFKMSDNNIWSMVELFLANEVKNKLIHEIGQLFEGSKNIPSNSIKNINMMKKYLQSEISEQLSELRKDIKNPSVKQFQSIMNKALENTFIVYEGALK
ncbi:MULTISPECIES: Qat anti-phage system associated protein QatB [Pectobacterium]|uniref:Qat anti-phage system associated protein QatB n=1 Tax=Pectobacterium TaxID=122277 RepID=UPI001F345774|nr:MULTISPECIES: Qat anti-phage system associated protein QatB [Pectobacterium]MDY4316837.1 Qat anti-phage system associated protein QatB [Pectobacterium actinidiae]GKW16699.1 hypothetical protein PEC301937_26480 [Pectobacterium carotovorum subsp. carotovorum]